MTCTLRTVLLAWLLSGAAANALAVDLLWNDAQGIHRFDTASAQPTMDLFSTFDTRGLVVDAANNRLIWTDVLPLGAPLPGGVIRTGPLSGGDFNTLVSRLTHPVDVIVGNRQQIVWSDAGDAQTPSTIFASEVDGAFPKERIREDFLSEITGLAPDYEHRKLYFSYINPLIDSIYNGAIACADLKDLSNVETVISGLARPRGLAIDVANQQLYWADAGLGAQGNDGTIMTARIGGERQTLVGGLSDPYGVALDLKQRDIYWTDEGTGKLQRTTMSGVLPFIEDVRSGLRLPTALAIVPEPTSLSLVSCGVAMLWLVRRCRPATTR